MRDDENQRYRVLTEQNKIQITRDVQVDEFSNWNWEKNKISQGITPGSESKQRIEVRHFTDLLRNYMLNGALERSNFFNPISLYMHHASQQSEFQVSIDNCMVNIQFENEVLKIPCLEVADTVELLHEIL
uniref:Uncharacterized protein n=1 Tax=Salix viminalis TaxID=40686 RepID=A0A6N2N0P7_SALVM